MSSKDAVWITGVGTATPLGNTFQEFADNLLAGKSGVHPVTRFNVSKHLCKIHAPIEPVGVPPGWDEADFALLDPYEQLFFWCASQALQDAGWWQRRSEVRLGLAQGLGAEWLHMWEKDWHAGGNRIRDWEQDRETVLDFRQRKLGLRGPAVTVAAACASANYALAQARTWLRLGWADVCLAGACDLNVTPMSLAGFGNLGALSRRNNTPGAASRPFDRGHDGFVMGEGGAFFVLENAAAARRRGARPYAEIAGFGASSDASHMVTPSADPAPAVGAMRAALGDAAVSPEGVDYVNAHAPSTAVGDRAEAAVLQSALGTAVTKVHVSSTKSMTGHLLSAAAAIEAVACLVALERQALPPTINLDDPDPECQLCHVPHHARPHEVRVAVSNSFGFGGSNSCLVLRKVA